MIPTNRLILLAALTHALAACHHQTPEPNAEVAPLPLFEKNRGVRLPDSLRQQLEVETAEVSEKALVWRGEKPAHTIRAAQGSQPGLAATLLSDSEAKLVHSGQAILLNPPNPESEPVLGTLARLDQSTRPILGQVEALIEFHDPLHRLPAGSSLTAVVTSVRTNLVPAIPASAVVPGVNGHFVYTSSGDHFTRTPVKLGAVADGWIEIVDGLYPGDMVVVKAAHALWMIELCALKGGTPCCPVPTKRRNSP